MRHLLSKVFTLATVVVMVAGLAGCGEKPFTGSEFKLTIDGNSRTFTTNNPVVPCQQSNADVYDNYGVSIGEFFSEEESFRFRIKNTTPGTFTSYKAEECCERFEEFAIDAEVDEGASMHSYDTDRVTCEGSAELTIEGKEHGLVYGEASGTICALSKDGTSRFTLDFVFATAESGSCI